MSEKLHLGKSDGPFDEGWDELRDSSGESSENETLPLYSKAYADYKISSMPFDKKEDAYKEINENWKGVEDVTTYYHGGKWYIVSK